MQAVAPVGSDEIPQVRGVPGRRSRILAGAGAILYIVGLSAYLLTHGSWPTPDYLIPPLLLMAVAIGRGWRFLFDWTPFLFLVITWQATASWAATLDRPVHIHDLVAAERWLFGGEVPTLWLQSRLYHPGSPRWYDWLAVAQHGAHFVLPVAAGLVLWLRDRRTYWRYVASVMVLFYLGFLGYVFFPAAPPWLASSIGALPRVEKIVTVTLREFPATAPVGMAYIHLNGNAVAAMPSLHAGTPLLVALVAIRLGGRRWLPALLYPLAMGYHAVYLGEHYVVDILAGYGVALVAYLAVWTLPGYLPLRWPRWSLPSIEAPRAVQRAGALALWTGAVAMAVLYFSYLAPFELGDSRPAALRESYPDEAPEMMSLTAWPCGGVTPTEPFVASLFSHVAGDYAVYLLDTNDARCYALASSPTLPPPEGLTAGLSMQPLLPAATDADVAPSRVLVDWGLPGPALVGSGLDEDREYQLVVWMADVWQEAATERVVSVLRSLLLTRTG